VKSSIKKIKNKINKMKNINFKENIVFAGKILIISINEKFKLKNLHKI
jgi:hypothetical protein